MLKEINPNHGLVNVRVRAMVIITLHLAVIYLEEKSYRGLFNTSTVKLTRIPGEQLLFNE